jgi:hypothetical protein
MTSVIEFASHHAITVMAILIALVAALRVFVFRKRPKAAEHLDFAIRLKESHADPLTFWRNEIRSVVEKRGSPVKAANLLKRAMDAPNLESISDNELESLHKYWREMSNWCGRVRIELHKLDPKQTWHPNAWTQLFNVFGEMNLRVKIAWDGRSRKRNKRN